MGSLDNPVSAAGFALAAGARFVGRGVDTQQKLLPGVLQRAHGHKGASFVEIFQNCIVYNDGAFAHFTERDVAEDAQLHVEHGKPLIFGKDRGRALRLKPGSVDLEVVDLGKKGVGEQDLLIHDETNRLQAQMLAALEPPGFPVALGVLYCDPGPSYEAQVHAQLQSARDSKGKADLKTLIHGGHTWTVPG